MSYFPKNIKWLRTKNDWSQSKVAEMIDVSRSAYANWEVGQAVPALDKIDKILELYSITYNQLTKTDMSTSRTSLKKVSKKLESIESKMSGNLSQVMDDYVQVTRDLLQKNVLIPIKAQASYMVGWPAEYFENELITIDVPGISGEARTFEVAGNSMWPIIMDGDYLACTRVERHQEIKEGVVYVIISRESGILAKYVRLEKEGLQMISANNLEYRPFIVSFDEVREIWEAKVKISKHFDPILPQNNNTPLLARIEKLESYLSQIFPEVKQE